MFDTKDQKDRRIIRNFCNAIFEACPWVAPESWHERKKRAKDLMDQMLAAAGMEMPK